LRRKPTPQEDLCFLLQRVRAKRRKTLSLLPFYVTGLLSGVLCVAVVPSVNRDLQWLQRVSSRAVRSLVWRYSGGQVVTLGASQWLLRSGRSGCSQLCLAVVAVLLLCLAGVPMCLCSGVNADVLPRRGCRVVAEAVCSLFWRYSGSHVVTQHCCRWTLIVSREDVCCSFPPMAPSDTPVQCLGLTGRGSCQQYLDLAADLGSGNVSLRGYTPLNSALRRPPEQMGRIGGGTS
jgi:hypothetical protein